MIIDCHTHILNENILREYLEKRQVDKMLCIRIFKGFCGGVFDNSDEGFDEFIDKHDNLYSIECIDFNTNILAQLDSLREKMEKTEKIKGLKLYPGYQHFYPYHERVLPVYNFAREFNIPVIFHSGALYEYKNSEALLQYTNPVYVDEAATRFNETRFVISHFGFPYMFEAAMVVNKNNNVFTDISGVIDTEECFEVYKDDLKKILKYYPGIVPQIMFGTDFMGKDTVLSEIDLYVRVVEEVFSPEDRELVFYKNAQRVYKLK